MIRIILFALLAWFLYKLIFRVIIPVYRTTRQVKKQFHEMRARMEEQQMNARAPDQEPAPKSSKAPASDYIEFEEIK